LFKDSKNIIKKDISKMGKKELKIYEDLLDAILCACISCYYWRYPSKCCVIGDMGKDI